MADNIFKVEIITPDRVFYTGQADFIELTTVKGEMGVYKNHIPLTARIVPCKVSIYEGEEERVAAVHSGFVEILQDKVTVLAEVAEWPGEIDINRAQAARERAEERLKDHANEIDVKRAEYALRKALTRIDVSDYKE